MFACNVSIFYHRSNTIELMILTYKPNHLIYCNIDGYIDHQILTHSNGFILLLNIHFHFHSFRFWYVYITMSILIILHIISCWCILSFDYCLLNSHAPLVVWIQSFFCLRFENITRKLGRIEGSLESQKSIVYLDLHIFLDSHVGCLWK